MSTIQIIHEAPYVRNGRMFVDLLVFPEGVELVPGELPNPIERHTVQCGVETDPERIKHYVDKDASKIETLYAAKASLAAHYAAKHGEGKCFVVKVEPIADVVVPDAPKV